MERLFEKFTDEISDALTKAQDEIANAAAGYKDRLFDEMDEQVQEVQEELEKTKKELEKTKKELASSQSLKEEIEQLKEQVAKSQTVSHSLEGEIKKLKMIILRKDSVIQAQNHRIKELQTDDGVWQTITHSVKKEQAGKEEFLFKKADKAISLFNRAIRPGSSYNPIAIDE